MDLSDYAGVFLLVIIAGIALLMLTRDVLETCIDLLGFSAPERM